MNDNHDPDAVPAFSLADFLTGFGTGLAVYVILTAALVLYYGWPAQ